MNKFCSFSVYFDSENVPGKVGGFVTSVKWQRCNNTPVNGSSKECWKAGD